MKKSRPSSKNSQTDLYLKLLRLGLIAALLPLFGIGCNTTRGFGKDVEKTGEGIQYITK